MSARLIARVGLLCYMLVALEGALADDTSRPNIIFIMADDLGYGDMGCYGQKLIQTPNIDRLAAEGMKFHQAYAGSSVCAPSRCSLMTGLHTGHAAVRDNIPHYPSYLEESDVTVAELLKQAGYRCGGVGKWSLGDAGTVGCATNQGFDTWFGYLNQDHAHYYYPEYLDDNGGRFNLPGNSTSRRNYSHDLMAQRALRFIRESQRGPFFLYAAFTLPHFSAESEDKTQLPIPSDAPYSNEPWTQQEKNYAAMVTLLDRDVGRIVQLVDELGLKEKTLIIFTSDHGPWGPTASRFLSSGPYRGAKRDLYEGGLRVPFIARWPGTIPANQTSNEIIAFCDMLPTFADLTGIQPTTDIDGISINNALRGAALEPPHEFLYWDYGHCRRRYDQAVRMQNWKGLRLGQQSKIELYDLSTDPGEQHDVSGQHPEVVEQIAQIMKNEPKASVRYPIGRIYEGEALWKFPGPSEK